MATLTVVAPAKVNLFLHVTGRRDDGYHELESLMALVDLCDTLTLTLRDDGAIVRNGEVEGVPAHEDLCVRAARALQAAAGAHSGVSVALAKRIPMGAGLGGGSSDAASVLLALNRLWHLDWPRAKLQDIAATLGADVPFFVTGDNAIARGIGDVLAPVTLPRMWLVFVHPQAHVRTADIFASCALTRDTPSAKIDVFSEGYGRNDLAAVTAGRFAPVAQALAELPGARMTGSGSCVFAAFASEHEALAARSRLAARCDSRIVRTLAKHPLAAFAR